MVACVVVTSFKNRVYIIVKYGHYFTVKFVSWRGYVFTREGRSPLSSCFHMLRLFSPVRRFKLWRLFSQIKSVPIYWSCSSSLSCSHLSSLFLFTETVLAHWAVLSYQGCSYIPRQFLILKAVSRMPRQFSLFKAVLTFKGLFLLAEKGLTYQGYSNFPRFSMAALACRDCSHLSRLFSLAETVLIYQGCSACRCSSHI
jgi:hypothetical protein